MNYHKIVRDAIVNTNRIGFELSIDDPTPLPEQAMRTESVNSKETLLLLFYSSLAFDLSEYQVHYEVDNFKLCNELMKHGINPLELDYLLIKNDESFFSSMLKPICPMLNSGLMRNTNPGAHRMKLFAKKMDNFAMTAFGMEVYSKKLSRNWLQDNRSILAYLILNSLSYAPLYAAHMETFTEMMDSLISESIKLSQEEVIQSCTLHLNFRHWNKILHRMKSRDKEIVHNYFIKVISSVPLMLNGRSLGEEKMKMYATSALVETMMFYQPDDYDQLGLVNKLSAMSDLSLMWCVAATSLKDPAKFVESYKGYPEDIQTLTSIIMPYLVWENMSDHELNNYIARSYKLNQCLIDEGLPGFFGSEAASSVLVNDKLAEYFYLKGYIQHGDDNRQDIFKSEKSRIEEYLKAVCIASKLGKNSFLSKCIVEALKSKRNDVNSACFTNPKVVIEILSKGIVDLKKLNLTAKRIEKLVRLGATMKMLKDGGIMPHHSNKLYRNIVSNDLDI